MHSRFAALVAAGLVACSSPTSRPVKTEVPPLVAPPAAPEQTCKPGQTPGEVKHYEFGVRSTTEQELGQWTVDASAKFPLEVMLGDKLFRVTSPVRRCDGDGRMHFLGVQVESNGLRTIGFTPPLAKYDGFGAPTNHCQIDPAAYCKATCVAGSPCDPKCTTMHAMPVLYACTNPITHELARTTEPPTDDEKRRGISEVNVVERLAVRSYEADIATGTWKSLSLVRERVREPAKRTGG